MQTEIFSAFSNKTRASPRRVYTNPTTKNVKTSNYGALAYFGDMGSPEWQARRDWRNASVMVCVCLFLAVIFVIAQKCLGVVHETLSWHAGLYGLGLLVALYLLYIGYARPNPRDIASRCIHAFTTLWLVSLAGALVGGIWEAAALLVDARRECHGLHLSEDLAEMDGCTPLLAKLKLHNVLEWLLMAHCLAPSLILLTVAAWNSNRLGKRFRATREELPIRVRGSSKSPKDKDVKEKKAKVIMKYTRPEAGAPVRIV